MDTRSIGRKLEEQIAFDFKEVYQYARPTIGSGSKLECGDVNQPYFIIECKKRNTDDITVKKSVWDKLMSEVPISSKRIPLYVLQNKSNDTWAVLKWEDFWTIFKKGIK